MVSSCCNNNGRSKQLRKSKTNNDRVYDSSDIVDDDDECCLINLLEEKQEQDDDNDDDTNGKPTSKQASNAYYSSSSSSLWRNYIGGFLLGMAVVTTMYSSFFSSGSNVVDNNNNGTMMTSSSSTTPPPSNPVQELGWSVVVDNIRADLGAFYMAQRKKQRKEIKEQLEKQNNRKAKKKKKKQEDDDLFTQQQQTVDITEYYEIISYALDTIGVRGVYNDLFDGLHWLVRDEPNQPHGIGNAWYGWFWLVHYTGAITAEKLLVDGSLLLDGSKTAGEERITDAISFVHEIQRIQKQPGKDHTTFHAMHAFVWRYVSSTMPDLETYPTELATNFCGTYLGHGHDFWSKSANKKIGIECYHGFGHAIFYVVAMRQLNDGYLSSSKYNPFDIKKQFRPQGGFQLNQESFCEAYRICGSAPNGTISVTPRKRCIGGVRHSTKLFALYQEGQNVTEIVTELEKGCSITSEVLEGLSW